MRSRAGRPSRVAVPPHAATTAACPFEEKCPCRRGPWCRQKREQAAVSNTDYRMLSLEGCCDGRCERPCKMLQHVEDIATGFLDAAHISNPPVPLELVHSFDPDRPVEIRFLPLNSHYGAVWLVNDAWVLHLNSNQSPLMNRYVAFHEGYHILCRLSAMHEGEAGDNCRPFNEAIADYFAASILMPTKWVRELWPQSRSIPEMSDLFQAPESAVRSWVRRWVAPLEPCQLDPATP